MTAAQASQRRDDRAGPHVDVYTDGACSGNPGPGGWGWVATDGRQDKGGEAQSTNQRMELQAVLEALRAIDGPVVVHSDSTYVVKCFNDRWYEGWLRKGWKSSANKPVANRDLWEPLIELYLPRRHEIGFVWVKGHAGDPMNEAADQLAVAAAQEQKVVNGDRSRSIRPAVAEGAAGGEGTAFAGIDAPWPIDHTVWAVGTTEPDGDQVDLLERSVRGLDPGRDVVLSGLRRGVELLAAERAVTSGVALAVVLPFDDPAAAWPAGDRRRFDHALAAAEWVVTLPGDARRPAWSLERRNEWTAGTVVGAVVVGDPDLAVALDARGVSVVVG